MNNQKSILFVVATHGDEKIGLEIVEALLRKGLGERFDYLVANPFALAKGQRFVDCDLNRSYPGKTDSAKIEEVLSEKNFELAKSYDLVVDIHEARCGSDNFIIIPRKEKSDIFPLELIDLNMVLLWPDPKGPMASLLENAIELEFGMLNKDRGEVVARAVAICEEFLNRRSNGGEKKFYEVYGCLLRDDFPDYERLSLKDFEQARIGDEDFYPLLVEQYIEDGIICYKMKKQI